MSGNKIIKSVSFNITNEQDQLMLKAIKRRNFSGYVKKLILEDLAKGKEVKEEKTETKAVEVPVKKEIPKPFIPQTAAERLEQLKKRANDTR